MKAIVTADNHLNKYYSKMRPKQLMERRQQLAKRFEQVVDYAIETNADVFLHCGDLFDMPNPRNPPLELAGRKLKELAENHVETFMVVGNHEMPKMRTGPGGSNPIGIFRPFEVAHLFLDPNQIQTKTLTVNGINLSISAISSNPLLPEGGDPLAGKEVTEKGDLSIFLTHYGIEGHMMGRKNEPIISHNSIANLGVDIFCAGHVHQPKNFRIRGTQVVIPGATERMDFGELNRVTGFYELTFTGGDLKVEFKRIEPQPMREGTVVLKEDSDDLTHKILRTIRDASHPEQLFKVKLQGRLPREKYHEVNVHRIWQEGRKKNFFFDVDDNLEFIIEERNVSGESLSQRDELKKVANRLEDEVSEEEKPLIRKAREMILSDYRELG